MLVGRPFRYRSRALAPYGSDDTLPSIEEVSGLLAKPTEETFTLAEYLEHLRDDR